MLGYCRTTRRQKSTNAIKLRLCQRTTINLLTALLAKFVFQMAELVGLYVDIDPSDKRSASTFKMAKLRQCKFQYLFDSTHC
jgi:hypothetical protein